MTMRTITSADEIDEAPVPRALPAGVASKLDAAQKRIAELGGHVDALQVALEASRGETTEAIRELAKEREKKAALSKRWRRTLDGFQAIIDASDRDAGRAVKQPTDREVKLADALWSDMRDPGLDSPAPLREPTRTGAALLARVGADGRLIVDRSGENRGEIKAASTMATGERPLLDLVSKDPKAIVYQVTADGELRRRELAGPVKANE